MRIRYIIILFIVIPALVSGQEFEWKSLIEKYASNSNIHSAEYFNQLSDSLQLVSETENPEKKAVYEFLISNFYLTNNNSDMALHFLLRAVSTSQKYKSVSEISAFMTKKLGDHYFSQQLYTKAAFYYDEAMDRSVLKNADYLDLWMKLAQATEFSGDYLQAINIYRALYDEIKKSDHLSDQLYALKNLSHLLKEKNRYLEALTVDSLVVEYCENYKIENYLPVAYNNLAYTYFFLNKFSLAIDYFLKSIGKTSGDSSSDLIYPNINIGICYQNMQNNHKAIQYLKNALDLAKQFNDTLICIKIENLIANTYLLEKDYYNAERHGFEAVSLSESMDQKELMRDSYLNYSLILKAGNDAINALNYYEKNLWLRDSLLRISQISKEIENQKISYQDQLEKNLKLNLANEDIQKLEMRRLKIETEKKEQQIRLLEKAKELEKLEKDKLEQSLQIARQQVEAERKEREIQNLALDTIIKAGQLKTEKIEKIAAQVKNEKLEAEKIHEKEIRKRVTVMLFLVGLIALTILISLITLHKKNSQLAQQKEIIEEKNRDLVDKNEEITLQSDLLSEKNKKITDSINYASIIQNALLPNKDLIKSFVDDSFIFFKPKDIVSGDFYWGADLGSRKIIVAADCTGHGVPGALMSMLGASFLNEIVTMDPLISSNSILDKLRELVISSLKQSSEESEIKDGMDIALVVLDRDKNIVEFSGANNPLYYIRDGELVKIAADRMPVSIHQKSHIPFTKKEIEPQKGDVFYIFSDGFADQFGGADGKKYKYTPFNEFLLSIHSKSCKEQEIQLFNEFEKWKGGYEQIDDVLIIGFKA